MASVDAGYSGLVVKVSVDDDANCRQPSFNQPDASAGFTARRSPGQGLMAKNMPDAGRTISYSKARAWMRSQWMPTLCPAFGVNATEVYAPRCDPTGTGQEIASG